MNVPRYADLPGLGELGLRHAWNVWGPGDRLGTMNRLTDRTTLRALQLPRAGTRISLSLPLDHLTPPLYGRNEFGHRVFDRNRNMVEDELTLVDPQSSSQWDSLRHIRAGKHGHYGGLAADDPDVVELGIDTLARHGLVMRGVLLDLPRHWVARGEAVDAFTDRPVRVAELVDCARTQGTRFEPGDLLLVRTGWLSAYAERGGVPEEHRAMPPAAGLEASEETAQFLWDGGFCSVATDNPAVENLPGDPAVGSLHRRLIPALGMPLGELWALDELADHCAAAGNWEACVVAVPLRVPGGVASPANAMAIV